MKKEVAKGIAVDEKNIYISGSPILKGNCEPYPDIVCVSDKYAFIGVHCWNPHCYEYFDRACIVRLSDLQSRIVILHNKIGNRFCKKDSKLNEVFSFSEGNVFYAKSDLHTVAVYPDKIFAPDIEKGAIIEGGTDTLPSELKRCFTYEVLEDYGILIRLREGIPRNHLLRFHGFNMAYNLFKFWDLDKSTSYLMFVDTDTPNGNSFEVSWGSSTSMVSGYIWQRRDALLECLKEVIPNHPAYRDDYYVEVID